MTSESTARDAQYATSKHLGARIRLHRRYTAPGQDIYDFVWAHYTFLSSQRVLEIGCGGGHFWTYPAAAVPAGLTVIMTDRSLGMLTAAKQTLSPSTGRLHLVAVDAIAVPFRRGTFDVGLAHFTLYHAADKHRALAELGAVTKSGGWVGIVLTGPQHMARIRETLNTILDPSPIGLPDSATFNAESAEPLIHRAFGSVRRYDYEYTMRVDDPEPVVAYARSLSAVQAAQLSEGHWHQFVRTIETEIQDAGAYEIRKSCTLFICRR